MITLLRHLIERSPESLFIEIPLALQFRHNLNPEKIALWASYWVKLVCLFTPSIP